ncbi:MAG: ATP-binding cassette domain-containing protein [Gorillibacterium sp.]|nr:ATP-binding cassette domain-containing protein [Gorillibacterium sp.]
MAVIEVENLTKAFAVKAKETGFTGSLRSLFRPEYREKLAVHSIGFTVEKGETLAFLGPNGAGKSTTIKMLSGILHPTDGMASVLGLCPWQERKRLAYRMGCVFGQKSQLWYHLPPADTFELMGRIYDLPRGAFIKRRDLLIERFELGPYLSTPVRKLSLGERMRCEIAAALLHQPEVIF